MCCSYSTNGTCHHNLRSVIDLLLLLLLLLLPLLSVVCYIFCFTVLFIIPLVVLLSVRIGVGGCFYLNSSNVVFLIGTLCYVVVHSSIMLCILLLMQHSLLLLLLVLIYIYIYIYVRPLPNVPSRLKTTRSAQSIPSVWLYEINNVPSTTHSLYHVKTIPTVDNR